MKTIRKILKTDADGNPTKFGRPQRKTNKDAKNLVASGKYTFISKSIWKKWKQDH